MLDSGVTRRCDELLHQFYLRDVMNQRVAALPYGKRRLLESPIIRKTEKGTLLDVDLLQSVSDEVRGILSQYAGEIVNERTVVGSRYSAAAAADVDTEAFPQAG